MKNFTQIPNQIFQESQLTLQARYLLCVLLKFCGQDESCFPSQKLLAKIMCLSVRQTTDYLRELEDSGIIKRKRAGFNRPNTYTVAREYENYTSHQVSLNKKSNSSELRALFPLHTRNAVPPTNTYRKEKDKRRSSKGLESLRETLVKRRIIPK